ncbi:MAG: trehalose-phosphatase [Synechococcaceae cyanobacterium SM1_2_3]|nr:trehalose-phosphatase [Synechococcaceae cyanobacterium SM1_2_3]
MTPLVEHPDLAHLAVALRNILAQLAALPRVTVGIVSGRGLDNLIRMVGLNQLYYGGTCGLELDLRGERVISSEAAQTSELFAELLAAVETALLAYPGAWVEQKPFGFTLHYRQLTEELIVPLRAEIAALLKPHSADLLILEGPLAVEVLPAIEHDKGTALRAIVAHSGLEPAIVLFAGDAANDGPALAVAAELGGISLGIGPEPPPEAVYRLADPIALHTLLAGLLDRLHSLCADQ